MDNTLSNLTVIIVTFKTDIRILKNCLNSIDKTTKILIVENSESFFHKKEIKEKFDNVEIVCTGSNLGMGAGNNFGFLKSKTDYALVLNPDIVCNNNFFTNIKKYLGDYDDYAIIGCQYLDNSIYKPAGYFSKQKNKNVSFENELTKVEWVVGCSMLFNLKKFKNKNIFDENFFLFFEEFDLCRRLINQGHNVLSSNKLIVEHLGFKSSFALNSEFLDEALKLRNWHYMWSQFFFNKRHENKIVSYWKGFFELSKLFLKKNYFFLTGNKIEKTKNEYRYKGLFCSMMNRKSSFRVKI